MFFELIKIAIGQHEKLSTTPTAEEWEEAYDLAQRQTLTGIAFCGVQRLPEEQRPPRNLLMKWYMAAEQIKRKNEKMDRMTLAVANKFAEEGFPGVILKGQGIAQLYRVGQIGNGQLTMDNDHQDVNDDDSRSRDIVMLSGAKHRAVDNDKEILRDAQDDNGENDNQPTGKQESASIAQHLARTRTDGHLESVVERTVPLRQGDEQNVATRNGAEGVCQSLGAYRTPGDIDIWLHGERKDILRYVRRHVPDCKPVYHHVDFPVIDGLPIEVHFTPSWMNSPFTNRRLQRFFRSFNFAFPFGQQPLVHLSSFNYKVIPSPSLAFNRVYVLVHIYRHLFHEGIGLRQLLDYYFVLRQGFTEEERAETMRTLRSLRMLRFTEAVMWVLQEVFALEDCYLLTTPNEVEGRFLLDEIMKAGNFGHYDERIKRSAKVTEWGLFRRRVGRNLRFVRSYPSEVLWAPLFKLWHAVFRLCSRGDELQAALLGADKPAVGASSANTPHCG